MATTLGLKQMRIEPSGDVFYSRNGARRRARFVCLARRLFSWPVLVLLHSTPGVAPLHTHQPPSTLRLTRLHRGRVELCGPGVLPRKSYPHPCPPYPPRPTGFIEVACNFVGLESYPYGDIGCQLELGSWVHTMTRVNLTL